MGCYIHTFWTRGVSIMGCCSMLEMGREAQQTSEDSGIRLQIRGLANGWTAYRPDPGTAKHI